MDAKAAEVRPKRRKHKLTAWWLREIRTKRRARARRGVKPLVAPKIRPLPVLPREVL